MGNELDLVAWSLALSAALVAMVNLVAFRSRDEFRAVPIVLICVVMTMGPSCLGLALKPLAVLAVLLPLASIASNVSGRGPRFFRSLSLAAALIAFAIPVGYACWRERDYARLRARYPYESIEDRLPAPKFPARRDGPPGTSDHFGRIEGTIRDASVPRVPLRLLHEVSVGLFIRNSLDFGSRRMDIFYPTVARLTPRSRDEPDPPQPGSRPAPPGSPGGWMPLPGDDQARLGQFYEESVVDFFNPAGFGYFKDRRHVAGFESHRFHQIPGSPGRWELRTLDLVGLLLHDEPRVYVTSHLPRMDALRDAPTRPLDRFEQFGLAAIQSGDDLSITQDGDTVRMVGAIRNLRQCIDCHGGGRGDLLGAFSYTLRAAEGTSDRSAGK